MTASSGPALDRVDFGLDPMPGDELHAVLRAYRERGPVQPTRFLGQQAFVISGHAALQDAFREVESFPPHRMYQVAFEGAIGKTFISTPDRDEHRTYRKLATPTFRSRAIERYQREGLAELAHELVDELAQSDRMELVADYAARLPYLVIARLLGLPRDREEEFHRWARALLQFREDPAAAAKASAQLTGFLAPVVEARRLAPRADVISELVTAEVDGRGLSDEEVYSHVRLLFPTGGETTHGSLGNLLSFGLRNPELWSALRADPSGIPGVVEESLRMETPIAVLPRMSGAVPVEFYGQQIPADSWVLFGIAGANRDPAVFADPDRFDPDRFDPERGSADTLTFGRGVKSCPGMHLAIKNMTVALEVLLERLPEPELLDRDAALPRRSVLRCPDALHVRGRILSAAS